MRQHLIPLRYMSWVYLLPTLHLGAFAVSNLGFFIPSLQYLARLEGYIIVADLPISLVVFALAWHYPVLAAIWLVIIGTLWWYLISRLLKLGVQKLLRKDPPFSTLKFRHAELGSAVAVNRKSTRRKATE